HRWRLLELQLCETSVRRSVGAPEAKPAHVRRQRDDADFTHDRCERPPHADLADGRVLPGAQAAQSPNGDDPLQRRMARHELAAVELLANAVVSGKLVRPLLAEEWRPRGRSIRDSSSRGAKRRGICFLGAGKADPTLRSG